MACQFSLFLFAKGWYNKFFVDLQPRAKQSIYMKKLFLIFCLLWVFSLLYGQKVTVSGHIYERGSLETLPGSVIYEPVSRTSVAANTYGFYTLTVPLKDTMCVVFTCFGYANDTLWIYSAGDREYDAHLSKVQMLQEVEITAERTISEQVQMSNVKLTAKEVKAVPMLFGEKDVFKTLLLLPGVQSASEGTSGIYVRGGGPDQNLVLLDEAILYNPSHLLGFFSIFNGDAVKSVELVKGGFPARYGGRLSYVIDVQMKDGNKESYHVEGGVGLISTNLVVEGPIQKQKSSFMLSGRTTYLDLFMVPIMKMINGGEGGTAGYYFFDLNGKLNFNLGKKDKLFASAYFGRDKFHMGDQYKDSYFKEKFNLGLFWQNATATARWNHIFTNKIFSNLSFVFSDYTMKTYSRSSYTFDFYGRPYTMKVISDFKSGIRDYTMKYDVSYTPTASHHLLFGMAVTYHQVCPNAVTMQEDTFRMKDAEKELGLEYAVYVEDEINIRNRFRINPGIRLVGFSVPGKTYFSPEPRISASVNILSNLAVKASYAMMSQSMILLSTSTIGLPTDLWVPVTDKVRPQRSQQVALGIHYDLRNPRLSFSLEGYYKKMDHILAYKEGSSYFVGVMENLFDETPAATDDFRNRWAQNVTSGQGWSYGMEFLARKEVGKFTGWIGYTLSWTRQQFDELNYGQPFFARYDRRHDVSIVLMYSPVSWVNLSLAWVYATGNAVTLPNAVYFSEDLQDYVEQHFEQQIPEDHILPNSHYQYIESYGEKNNIRMKPFHHLDVSVQFIKPNKKKGESIFDISIYNIYNHKNPFFYYLESEGYDQNSESVQKIMQICIFPIIPTFTYRFKF